MNKEQFNWEYMLEHIIPDSREYKLLISAIVRFEIKYGKPALEAVLEMLLYSSEDI